jgi:hypothetical protein
MTQTKRGWADQEDWQVLLGYLPTNYRELADEHEQVLTKFGSTKVADPDDLLRLILLHVGANMPLRQTVALASEAGGPQLSPMRLHMKMRKAAPYLAALVQKLAGRTEAVPERWGGYDMVAIDGSAICGPGAETTDSRIHLVLRLVDLRLFDVRVTDVTGGETFKRFHWLPDQLAIADRGYANGGGIGWVVDHGADVLVRVNRGVLRMFETEGEAIDVLERLRSLKGTRAEEWTVTVRDPDKRRLLPGRFVAARLPEAEAKKARERVIKERGVDVTTDDIEAAEYVALFTTAGKQRLPTQRCLDAYRLRWQVELQFKRWKSLCGFDRLPNYRDDTIVAWVYAKVLLGILMDRMATSASTLFPPEQCAPRPRKPRTRHHVEAHTAASGSPTVETHQHPVAGHRRRRPTPAAA